MVGGGSRALNTLVLSEVFASGGAGQRRVSRAPEGAAGCGEGRAGRPEAGSWLSAAGIEV